MRSQVRALAEAGKVTECQRNCQSSGETSSLAANLVIEVPRGWSSGDVRNQEIPWGVRFIPQWGATFRGGIESDELFIRKMP